VSRRGPFDRIEDRFGKWKFEDDFTGIVGDFQYGIENTLLFAVGFENFPNCRSCHAPGVIRIAQNLSLRVEDQFFADAGVEKISRHETDFSG